MGCASSTDPALRRTRSGPCVAGEDPATALPQPEDEDNRNLISELQSATVTTFFSASTNVTCSVTSELDPDAHRSCSYKQKNMQRAGDGLDPANDGVGYTCHKGLKPESPNQDAWTLFRVEDRFAIYGVFDGHGIKGHDVSNFVKDTLVKLIVRDERFLTAKMPEMLKDSFKKCQSLVGTATRMGQLTATFSGTTVTVCVHDLTLEKLTIAHAGCDTCCMASYEDCHSKVLSCKTLTRNHKPNLPDERERVLAVGGRVTFDGYQNHRISAKGTHLPGLSMSRCLGDLMGHNKAGLSCEPEILERQLTPNDNLLFLCSDGIWEFIDPQEAVTLLDEFGPTTAMKAAETLAKEAWNRWIKEEGGSIVDDITAILVYLQHKPCSKGAETDENQSDTVVGV